MITAPSTQLVPTTLGRLHVRVEGAGPVAMLWHGMFVDGTSWDMVALQLSAHRTLVIVDGPAHGRSETLDRSSTITECATVAGEILDRLAINGPVDWVGNAWGGHVGMRTALDAPDRIRSLVAISAPPTPISPELRRRITLLRPLLRTFGYRGPLLSAVLGSQLTVESTNSPDIRERVVDALRRPNRAGVARAITSFILDREDMLADLHRLQAPTLFVASDDRGEFTQGDAQQAAQTASSGSWVVANGARALVPLEQPQWLVDTVLQFWKVGGQVDRNGHPRCVS